MRNFLFSTLFAAALASCQNTSQPTTENTSAPTADTIDLTSLDQWRSYGKETLPAQGWVMEGNELVIQKAPRPRPEGFGGDIITKQKFGNFELSLEFMVTDTANSGIFYFVTEQAGTPIYFNAPEFQILDDATYLAKGEVGPTQLTGGNYDMHAAPSGLLRPVGEWNTARIIHQNGHVEHWLNGQKAVEYEVGSPEWEALVKKSKFKDYPGYGRAKTGHIGLQDHDHEVRFRKIKIREP